MGLTLSHFANLKVHDTLDPELSLGILHSLRVPRSSGGLKKSLKTFAATDVDKELTRLRGASFVIEAKSSRSKKALVNPLIRSIAKTDEEAEFLSATVANTRIGISEFVPFGDELIDALAAFGMKNVKTRDARAVGASTRLDDKELEVVIARDRDRFSLSRLNQTMLAKRKKWLLVTVDAFGGSVGPFFGHDGGPCYDCLIDHSRRHLETTYSEERFEDFIEGVGSSPEDLFPLAKPLSAFAATEIFKAASRIVHPKTRNGFFRFDFFNFRMDFTVTNPSPTCPVCTDGGEVDGI